ncbi:hypothetical protein PFISCL1PPCAC_4711, partial [Pristionchus fissidentatus]
MDEVHVLVDEVMKVKLPTEDDYCNEEFAKWISMDECELMTPICPIIAFSNATCRDLFNGKATHFVLLFVQRTSDKFAELFRCFEAAAQYGTCKTKFVWIDTEQPANTRIRQFFCLNNDDGPAIRGLSLDFDLRRFAMEPEEFTAEN